MASLIKNQILKHLSKFTKNLSNDKIHLSTLKGEGDLSNLELNEDALMELLELPSWIRLSKAVCNKVHVKIQWTKLKTHPIYVHLDEVLVEMETCEELRQPSAQSQMPSYSSGGKYGFSDRVIDGMMVCVNSVIVNFKSRAFKASIQISRMQVQSLTPQWKSDDLRRTRLKDPDRGELLIFKELEWQTLRIEANALETADGLCNSSPLRLITNQSKCRITVKKKLIDCSVVTSRLHFILDDLLWVLTDTQLKAAMTFMASLSDLIQKSDEISKSVKAARKLEAFPEYKQWLQQQPKGFIKNESAISKIFNLFDIIETSYHIHLGRLDLHLCDDLIPEDESKVHYNSAIEGGAMQITLFKLAIDYYPYHLASANRKNWVQYKENSTSRGPWVEDLFSTFQQKLQKILKDIQVNNEVKIESSAKTQSPKSSKNVKSSPANTKTICPTMTIMSSCCIVRLDNFELHQVSTLKHKRGRPHNFFSSDKRDLFLPKDMPAIHAEYTEYYYPDNSNYPVPAPNVFLLINPVKLVVDNLTILWLNSFILNLQQASTVNKDVNPPHIDVRLEALMPRIVFKPEKTVYDHPDRPKAVQLQASNIVITNCSTSQDNFIPTLCVLLQRLEKTNLGLFHSHFFPAHKDDLHVNFEPFWLYAKEKNASPFKKHFQKAGSKEEIKVLCKDLFWTKGKDDIWNFEAKQLWIDFIETQRHKNRPLPFIDAFPLSLWIYRQLSDNVSNENFHLHNGNCTDNNNSKMENEDCVCNDLNIRIIISIGSKVRAQLTHLQYLVLQRLLESFNELQLQFYKDSSAITKHVDMSSFLCAYVVEELEFFFIFPPIPSTTNGSPMAMNSGILSEHNNDPLLKSPSKDHELNNNPLRNTDELCDYSMDKEDTLPNEFLVPPSSNNLMQSLSDSALRTSVAQGLKPNSSGDSSPPLLRANKCIDHKKLHSTDSLCSELSFKPKLHEGRPSSKTDVVVYNIKKSLTNARHNLDSALAKDSLLPERKRFQSLLEPYKWNMFEDSGLSDDIETVSIHSNVSSDDDDAFILLNAEQSTTDELGSLGYPLETASPIEFASEVQEDVYNETNSSITTEIFRPTEMVSLVVFHFHNLEVVQQSIGLDSILKMQCNIMETEEQGNMSWDAVQSIFSKKNKNISNVPSTLDNSSHYCLKMRFSQGPSAEQLCPTAAERGFFHVMLDNLSLDLKMSTAINMTDFVEDEIIPLPMPIHIDVNDLKVHFEEDRPATNESSPGPIPVDIHIPSALINRSPDGVFHMIPKTSESIPQHKPLSTAKGHQDSLIDGADVLAELAYLRAENATLKTSLANMESLQENLKKLENVHAENFYLSTQLSDCKDDIESREKEKSSLIATLQLLQDELFKSEEMRGLKNN